MGLLGTMAAGIAGALLGGFVGKLLFGAVQKPDRARLLDPFPLIRLTIDLMRCS